MLLKNTQKKMLKYTTSRVVFREIPDEITLAINISGCPIHCPDCHSKELWEDIGTNLSERALNKLIVENPGITCVAFMGGDNNPEEIKLLSKFIKINYPKLKIAWYSGRDIVPSDYFNYLNYLKLGPYISSKGPLDNPNTNQRLYKLSNKVILTSEGKPMKLMEDITDKFWNKS